MTPIKAGAFLIVFFVGALTSSLFEWLAPITTIEVTNASDKVIRSLDITYRGMGEHMGRLTEGLRPGEKIIFKWTTDGEASYRLHAIFEDGTEVKGGAGYMQRGNTVKEAIETKRVMSERPVWFTFGLGFHPPWETTSRAVD